MLLNIHPVSHVIYSDYSCVLLKRAQTSQLVEQNLKWQVKQSWWEHMSISRFRDLEFKVELQEKKKTQCDVFLTKCTAC